jgi:DNA polymerase-3 subunit epsilon
MNLRQVVLDTETTGLEAREGHRIIEVGCIEIVGRRVSDRRLHHYINPGRASDEGALAVHGLTEEFLGDKPAFEAIVDELLAFVAGAEVIIHNASFDCEFLDEELRRLGRPPFASHCAALTDSLKLAREIHPGKRNSLDALGDRSGGSNAHRTLHGALLDAGLLADVYLAMTRGQDTLVIDLAPDRADSDAGPIDCSGLTVLEASAEEREAHVRVLASLDKASGGRRVWTAG